MRKVITALLIGVILISVPAYAGIKINGWFNDWTKVKKLKYDKKKDVEDVRSGMDFLSVSMKLEKKFLYVFIKGISLTAGHFDSGVSLTNTSVRMSFVSASNPLTRMRIAFDPKVPGVITVSQPSAKTRKYGSKKKPYWKYGKIGKWRHGVEIKIPVYNKKRTTYIGTYGGPVISKRLAGGKKRRVCDVFITNVNTRTHLFMDKVQLALYDTTF